MKGYLLKDFSVFKWLNFRNVQEVPKSSVFPKLFIYTILASDRLPQISVPQNTLWELMIWPNLLTVQAEKKAEEGEVTSSRSPHHFLSCTSQAIPIVQADIDKGLVFGLK